jgi:hypothetical protein
LGRVGLASLGGFARKEEFGGGRVGEAVAGWEAARGTCAPEAPAAAAAASPLLGSDDRAVRKLCHPAASVITLPPLAWPEFGLF